MWVRIEDEIVVELTDIDPEGRYHPSLVWVVASSDVSYGDKFEDGYFSKIIEPVPSITRIQIETLRLIAYADPINGSDRYFSEVMSLQAEGYEASSLEVKETKAKGLAKKAEIKALHPYPVE
jgi:hypothetical protein